MKGNSIGGKFLLRWAVQGVVAGTCGAILVRSFDFFLSFLPAYRSVALVHPVVDAILSALLVGLVLYRLAPGAAGEGIPAYLDAIGDRDGVLPLKDTLIKYPAALASLGFWGSGGMVAPLGRVSAGISQSITIFLQKLIPSLFVDSEEHETHYYAPTTAAIVGMAAAVAAVFGAPIAGAVFSVEVIQRDQLRYHQLFPAILSSSTAVFLMEILGWTAPFQIAVTAYAPEALEFGPIVVVGLASGLVGRLYTALYRGMAHHLGRRKNRYVILRLAAGMAVAALVGLSIHPLIYGTSARLSIFVSIGDIDGLAIRWLPLSGGLLLVVFLLAKMVATCFTVASGMSAGFTGPAALIGMFTGAAIALFFGFPAGGHAYTSLVVAGFAGTLASTVNVPLAAAILAMEVFAPSFGVPAGISGVIAFQTARYNTIYEVALQDRWTRSGV